MEKRRDPSAGEIVHDNPRDLFEIDPSTRNVRDPDRIERCVSFNEASQEKRGAQGTNRLGANRISTRKTNNVTKESNGRYDRKEICQRYAT